MSKVSAICLQCGGMPTIKAHLIPQAFARQVRGGDPNHFFSQGKSSRILQNSLFDTEILCSNCDNTLGVHEKYAFEILGHAFDATRRKKKHTHVSMSPVNGDRLVRFAAGIAWKFAVTKKQYGQINIGPYQQVLRKVAFESEIIPSSINLFMARLKGLDHENKFYRAPKRDRQFGVNFVRLTLGGFIMFLKIDKRPPPTILYKEIWMRGQGDEVVFPVLPLDLFEEGRHLKESWNDERFVKFILKAFETSGNDLK